jgi:DNA-binding CsgD family transcriptional regulator
MKSKKISIPLISQQKFLQLWAETRIETNEDENKIYNFFKPFIEGIPRLTLGEYYWQIFNNAQPFPNILMAEGAVSRLTPFDSKGLVNSTVEEFFSIYHPDDLTHVFTFLSNIFRIIIDEHSSKRNNYNITIYARIKNGDGVYSWNSIQYPALYFDENDNFLYGMALYSNVNHIMEGHTEPMMTVLNSDDIKNQQLIHYSMSNMNGVPKIYPSVSQREKEIIVLLSKGKSSKQIADILNISKNTVDNHRQRLLKKFEVKSSSELVVKALVY